MVAEWELMLMDQTEVLGMIVLDLAEVLWMIITVVAIFDQQLLDGGSC